LPGGIDVTGWAGKGHLPLMILLVGLALVAPVSAAPVTAIAPIAGLRPAVIGQPYDETLS